MISSYGEFLLSKEQMKMIIGGILDAQAEAACDETFSLKCSGGVECKSQSGSKGYCECKDNEGEVVDYKECILQ
ncbi:hypothetical protein [Emticicia oligotrophica]|nr:hypothetical protein [Emticicia oligotrophica]